MKTTLLALFLAMLALPCLAQDFNFPVTTKSDEARKAYNQAFEGLYQFDFDKFNSEIDKAQQLDPEFFCAGLFGSYEEYQQGKKDLFNAEADKLLKIDRSKLNAVEQGLYDMTAAMRQDDKAKAVNALEKVTAENGQYAQLHFFAASFDMDHNENQKALQHAQKLTAMRPTFGPGFNQLGYINLAQNNLPNAKAAFEKYRTLEPNHANPYDSFGDYYMAAKDYNAAAEMYDKAAALGMTASKERANNARQMAGKK